jgi:hypothetical protein
MRTFESEARRLARRSPQEVWRAIEDDFGPLNRIADDDLKQCLRTHLRIADITGDPRRLHVPPVIAARILIETLRRAADAQSISEAKRLQRRLRTRLPGRPKLRPVKNRIERYVRERAVQEFDRRQWALRGRGLSREDAIARAAEEAALDSGVSPDTVISWWQHQGRWRRK